MLDLEAMKREKTRQRKGRDFKTYISDDAYDRVNAAAAYTGCFAYEIVEKLIVEGLPPVAAAEGDEHVQEA